MPITEKILNSSPHPTLSNLVLVGNNSAENKRGIRLRRGTEVSISNATVCGKPQAITTESLETENALKSGRSILSNITASTTLASREGIYTSADFEAENCVDASLAFGSYSEVLARCPWITGSWVR